MEPMIEQLKLKQAYDALQEFGPPNPEAEEAINVSPHPNLVQRIIDTLRWFLNGAHHSRG